MTPTTCVQIGSPAAYYRRASNVSYAAHADHVVVLDPSAGRYYGLDQVGAYIWELLANRITAGEMVDRIVDEYKEARQMVEADVDRFLAQMTSARLIAVEKRS